MNTSSAVAATQDTWPGPPAEPREMHSAERVQAQLRPHKHPQLETLEFAGNCLPGRAVVATLTRSGSAR